ncbi:MAG TPA: hypothetical protein VGM88_03280 [Kofleriaceae bacterium]|jgi:hypothetical protein
MRQRRRGRVPPDLTSLFDVLFIVVFAALIRATAAEHAAAAPAPAPAGSEQHRAIAALDARTPVIVRIVPGAAADPDHWHVGAIEVGARKIPVDAALLARSASADVALSWVGGGLCKTVAAALGETSLEKDLVIFAPARPIRELPVALYDGLAGEVGRCFADLRGYATLVEP